MPVSEGLTWGTTSATVNVGETVTVNVTYGMVPTSAGITSNLNGLATATLNGNTVTFTGVSAGTVTLPTGTGVGNTCLTTNPFTLTVASADDQNFLNERGLARFWNNIDTLKQDKLTAGTNITISANNTISASQPTVGNATLTIQKNGTNVQTFTANATSNKTANITVPTAVTDLSDASNYVTQTDIADVIRTTDVGVIKGQNIADSEITSSKIDWTTQTYTVTLGQHIESYSEVTAKSFGGIATIKGFLVTNAVVAQGEALFTISNCPDALKNQRIPTTGAAGIPYYYIDYDGKAFYDIGTVPVGNILFGVTFI